MDFIKYKGNNPIFKAVGKLANITVSEFFIYPYFNQLEHPDIVVKVKNGIKIYTIGTFYFGYKLKNELNYTIENRFCDFYEAEFEQDVEQVCIISVPYEVIIVQRAWRKYRLRTSRIRNDLVIHGLAEYWGHPSRLTFEV